MRRMGGCPPETYPKSSASLCPSLVPQYSGVAFERQVGTVRSGYADILRCDKRSQEGHNTTKESSGFRSDSYNYVLNLSRGII